MSTKAGHSNPSLVEAASMRFLLLVALITVPLAAEEEALYGTWEGSIPDVFGETVTTRWTFRPDGTFLADAQVSGLGWAESGDDSTRPWPEDLPESLLEEFTVMAGRLDALSAVDRMSILGTYEVEGEELTIQYERAEVAIDGEDVNFLEFALPAYIWAYRMQHAALLLWYNDVSEEEWWESFVSVYEALLAIPEFQEAMDEVTLELQQAFGALLMGDYSIEDDTLSCTFTLSLDGVEQETALFYQFRRTEEATAVVRTTWGTVKNRF